MSVCESLRPCPSVRVRMMSNSEQAHARSTPGSNRTVFKVEAFVCFVKHVSVPIPFILQICAGTLHLSVLVLPHTHAHTHAHTRNSTQAQEDGIGTQESKRTMRPVRVCTCGCERRGNKHCILLSSFFVLFASVHSQTSSSAILRFKSDSSSA